MISDVTGKQLHDRLTRNETLTPDEQALLTAWYTAQDSAEMDLLPKATTKIDLETLERQVNAASAQLTAVTERIQEVAAENNTLRQEISRLRQQLVNQI
jgi:peptidoglycan hydrolase CwlO-like protein